VGKWRIRFLEQRINGLYDEVRPGKPRTIDDERLAQLIHKTLHTQPADGSTHWSVRTIAAETAISPTSVHRYFKLLGLQPHRSESFKLSTDQFFIEKLRDVVGLYLSPPENALVLCVDEKSQCQALERSPRHRHAVRRAERAQRCSTRHLQAASQASGIPVVLA
jgi:AraC-like DNA-binding protein